MSDSDIVSRKLQKIAQLLDGAINDGTLAERHGFAFFVFNPAENGYVNYISNCERGDVRKALTEIMKGWDAGMPDVAGHKRQ